MSLHQALLEQYTQEASNCHRSGVGDTGVEKRPLLSLGCLSITDISMELCTDTMGYSAYNRPALLAKTSRTYYVGRFLILGAWQLNSL